MTSDAIISFCSNDWRFLKHCIEGISPFCRHIFITVCDHFFDGREENYALLEEAFTQFPQCTFLAFSFDPVRTYRPFSPLFPGHHHWRHEWHNTGRWLGYLYSDADYLLFLDCDEIADTEKFSAWLDQTDLKQYTALRFAALWHFREAKFVATSEDDCSLLVQRAKLRPSFLWDEDERIGLFQRLSGPKQLHVKGVDGSPMFHHYSGVRTQEEFQRKLASWGHHWERNWQELLDEEYSRPFNGTDFIRRYRYQSVDTAFDPLAQAVPVLAPVALSAYITGLHRFQNVVRVTQEEAFRRDLENDFSHNH